MLRSVIGMRIHEIPLHIRRLFQLYRFRGLDAFIGLGAEIRSSRLGRNVYIGNNVMIDNVTIGDRSYINRGSSILNTTLGKYCSIGPNVQIVVGGHPMDMVSTHPAFYASNKSFHTYADQMYFVEYGRAEIGNDVWIGEGALIPGNIVIGDGAVVASRAVVTTDVEPYSVVGGIPARHIRYRFDEPVRRSIALSKWWDWDEEDLQRNFSRFHDPHDFINFLAERKLR
jgi:acetyltransferase-like isoleucine patch superfamily enzyme